MSPDIQPSPEQPNLGIMMKDICQWRRKKLSAAVLVGATAFWVALEVYQFNFITIVSWIGLIVTAVSFLSGAIFRLFHKEAPKLEKLEMREEMVEEIAKTIGECFDGGMKWMFRVSMETEWYAFLATLVCLWILSVIGSCFELPSLLYFGTLVGMAVPKIYEKNEKRMKELEKKMRMKMNDLEKKMIEFQRRGKELLKKYYNVGYDKVVGKNKTNNPAIAKEEEKEKIKKFKKVNKDE
ncbi:reticulon-like protein B13 [Impatiens glandulifera]|uniref:reticulon-like protein B13 n=1 Tax=Impatiens glandulifera TaxID=253017 RepID=UPI001FB09C1E|nr:reticulon-like protein B13 [Impatiens glandulifera]